MVVEAVKLAGRVPRGRCVEQVKSGWRTRVERGGKFTGLDCRIEEDWCLNAVERLGLGCMHGVGRFGVVISCTASI